MSEKMIPSMGQGEGLAHRRDNVSRNPLVAGTPPFGGYGERGEEFLRPFCWGNSRKAMRLRVPPLHEDRRTAAEKETPSRFVKERLPPQTS